jgi:Skp family chaperone for outer membrane proteins
VRDRQNAAAEKPVGPQTNAPYDQYADEVKCFGKMWADIWKAEREAKTRDERIAAQSAKVRAARATDNQRRIEDQREREQRQARVFAENIARNEVRQILADATGEEIQEVLKRVEAAHCKGFPAAYSTYLAEVRAERKSK